MSKAPGHSTRTEIDGGDKRKTSQPKVVPLFSTPVAILLTAAGGTAILLSFPRFDQFWLAWFAATFMILAFHGRGFRQAFGLGMIAGFIANMGGFYWISNMLREFAHLPMWLSWVITCLLIAYQGVYYALAAGVSAAIVRKYPRLPWLAVFPAAYTAFEFVYPLIFPWYAGNGQQLFYAAIQIADLGGAPAISFMLMLIGAALAEIVAARMKRETFPTARSAIVAGLFAATMVYGVVRINQVDERVAEAPKFRIGMVEADVGIWEKEAKKPDGSPMSGPEKAALLFTNLLKHQYLSCDIEQKHQPDLIVWPETAYLPFKHVYVKRAGGAGADAENRDVPKSLKSESWIRTWPFPTDMEKIYVSRTDLPASGSYLDPMTGYRADNKTPMQDRNAARRGFTTPFIFGAGSRVPDTPPDSRPVKYNTAVMMDGDGSVLGMYRKTKLLIFGEYLPFEKHFPFLRKWLPEAGVWSPGDGPHIFELGDARIGINICYEDLLAPFHREMAALNPNVLVNITNDAWFGKTREPWLHLQLAELRCVETRMFMARATNTGISAFVDPVGRRISHTSMEDPEYLVADVGLTSEKTVYVRFGDVFAWVCVILTGFFALLWLIPVRNGRPGMFLFKRTRCRT